MRIVLVILLLSACTSPNRDVKDVIFEQSMDRPMAIRLQHRLQMCEGRNGPMASWPFAFEMRLACSRQGTDTLIEFLDAMPPSPGREPLIFCGGTFGPADAAEAREQQRSCKGRSGWVEPVRE